LPVSLFLIINRLSHSKIRTEKICLNCGTETTGRYCPACGQENIEPKQSVGHLVTHFFSDLTHFDGKFFITVKDLFAKPGFLSKEYMLGRRARYLDPIRMYIFTSAFFFLIFLSIIDVKKLHIGDEARTEIQKDADFRDLLAKAKTTRDSSVIQQVHDAVTTPVVKTYEDSSQKPHGGVQFKLEESDYPSIGAYDSAQKALPFSKRDGWLKRKFNNRKIELNLRKGKDPSVLFRELLNNYTHNIPKVLFISLPAFALLLKLLYIRRKQFYYVDHLIFSVHLYIFSFLILLAYFGLGELKTDTGWNWLKWLIVLVLLFPFFYFYKAMRRFYGQGRGKTILKYILLFMLSFFVQLLIFTGAFVFSVFEF
jgi:hypothetical protein